MRRLSGFYYLVRKCSSCQELSCNKYRCPVYKKTIENHYYMIYCQLNKRLRLVVSFVYPYNSVVLISPTEFGLVLPGHFFFGSSTKYIILALRWLCQSEGYIVNIYSILVDEIYCTTSG